MQENKPMHECIMYDETSHDSNRRLIVYEPGNCTRYLCCFTFLGDFDGASREIGGHDCILTIINMGRSMTLYGGDVESPHWSYVAEKLDFNEADAVPIARLIDVVLSARNS